MSAPDENPFDPALLESPFAYNARLRRVDALGPRRRALCDELIDAFAGAGGVAIPKGSFLVVRFASANRDEQVFADPDRFDVERPNAGEQLAFDPRAAAPPFDRCAARLDAGTQAADPTVRVLKVSPACDDKGPFPGGELAACDFSSSAS